MIEYHRRVLSDTVRITRWREALDRAVSPGAVVADLGAGTGVLSCLACQAGAGRVHAIERGDIVETARRVARDNGFDQRITWYQADAAEIMLPEKVDVVLGDIIGVFGLEDGLLRIFGDFAAKNLKAGGRLVPQQLEIAAAPWELAAFHTELGIFKEPLFGLDLSACAPLAFNRLYGLNLPASGRLARDETVFSLLVGRDRDDRLEGTVDFSIEREGQVHGFGVWFDATLVDGVHLETAPEKPPTVWQQGFLPLDRPLLVHPADRLRLTLSTVRTGERLLWGWKGEVSRGSDPGFAHFSSHTFHNLPVSSDALRLLRQDRLPRRSHLGDCLYRVLSAMDGSRSLSKLARQLAEGNPELFPTSDSAIQFILEKARRWGVLDAPVDGPSQR